MLVSDEVTYERFLSLLGLSPVLLRSSDHSFLIRYTPSFLSTLRFELLKGSGENSEMASSLMKVVEKHEKRLYSEICDTPRYRLNILPVAVQKLDFNLSTVNNRMRSSFIHMLFHSVIANRFTWAGSDATTVELRQPKPISKTFECSDRKASKLWEYGMVNWRETIVDFMQAWKGSQVTGADALGPSVAEGQSATERLLRRSTQIASLTKSLAAVGNIIDAALGIRALLKVFFFQRAYPIWLKL